MSNTAKNILSSVRFFRKHAKIVSALMFREATTRYGRDNLGLLWVIGEPFIFAVGVFIMWSIIRPPYDNGVALLPFLLTGYPPLILVRHTLSHGMNTIIVNTNLLYHRKITVLHMFVSRCLLEIVGATIAFSLLSATLIFFNIVSPPKSFLLIYVGWFLLSWLSFGFAVILGSIVGLFEWFEKFGVLLTYVIIPFTGAFYMVAWIPYQYRSLVLSIPFVNCFEMIRGGFFGEFYPTFYNVGYTAIWAGIFTLIGLFLLLFVRSKIDVE